MKKSGFTLAEVLISLCIVGILAAIMMPMVNKYRPDENKIRFLQMYQTLGETIPAIANSQKAYPIVDGSLNYNDAPLMNVDAKINVEGEEISGVTKFCRLLAMGLNTTGTISCPKDFLEPDKFVFTPSFTTDNGIQLMVQTKRSLNTGTGLGEYVSEVYIDVNGVGNGNDCFATTEACKEPDRFKLGVSADGSIKPLDARAKDYIKTKANWKKNNDQISYAELSILPSSVTISILPDDTPPVDIVTITTEEKIPTPPPPPKYDIRSILQKLAYGGSTGLHSSPNSCSYDNRDPATMPFNINYKTCSGELKRGEDFTGLRKTKYKNLYFYEKENRYFFYSTYLNWNIPGYNGTWSAIMSSMSWLNEVKLIEALEYDPNSFANSGWSGNITYKDKYWERIEDPDNVGW